MDGTVNWASREVRPVFAGIGGALMTGAGAGCGAGLAAGTVAEDALAVALPAATDAGWAALAVLADAATGFVFVAAFGAFAGVTANFLAAPEPAERAGVVDAVMAFAPGLTVLPLAGIVFAPAAGFATLPGADALCGLAAALDLPDWTFTGVSSRDV